VRATDGAAYGPIVLIAAATGMRLGEILALRWTDLDLKAGTVSVNQSLEETKAGLKAKAPKSDRGRRLVPIPANVVHRLLAYKEQQEAHAQARSEANAELWVDNGVVCCNEGGHYRKPGTVSSVFRDIAKRAGVRELGIHALRHAHASMLANRGWQAKIIQERLGHPTIAVTMDIYSHILPTTQQEAADSLSSVFGPVDIPGAIPATDGD
jgi:integrase